MCRVIVILSDKNRRFSFEKQFELSAVPAVGFELFVPLHDEGGYISVMVARVRQFIDEDYFQVFCEASLRGLCSLFLNKRGWTVNDEDVFLADSSVKKMIGQISLKDFNFS